MICLPHGCIRCQPRKVRYNGTLFERRHLAASQMAKDYAIASMPAALVRANHMRVGIGRFQLCYMPEKLDDIGA